MLKVDENWRGASRCEYTLTDVNFCVDFHYLFSRRFSLALWVSRSGSVPAECPLPARTERTAVEQSKSESCVTSVSIALIAKSKI